MSVDREAFQRYLDASRRLADAELEVEGGDAKGEVEVEVEGLGDVFWRLVGEGPDWQAAFEREYPLTEPEEDAL